MDAIIFTLVEGLTTGAMYGLLALGIVLVYRGTRVINFATPALGSLGLYVAHVLHVEQGANWLSAAIVGLLAGGLVALAFERFVVRRMQGATTLAVAVATIGLMLLIITSEALFFGAAPRNFRGPFSGRGFAVAGAQLTPTKLLSLVVAIALTVGLTQFLRRTDFGLGVQAAAMDADAVRLVGIRLADVNAFVWGVGGMLAVIATVLIFPSIGGFAPGEVTRVFFVPALAAALIGGIDNLEGALFGGVAVGLIIETAKRLFLQSSVSGTPQLAILLAIIAVLLFAPRGVVARAREVAAK